MADEKKPSVSSQSRLKRDFKSMEGETIDELVRIAPRFRQLASRVKRSDREASEPQRKFLEEFADELAKGFEKEDQT